MSKSKTVSMIIFDGSFESFESIRKFVGNANIYMAMLSHRTKDSEIVVWCGEERTTIFSGDSIVRRADGILKRRRKRRVQGYAE